MELRESQPLDPANRWDGRTVQTAVQIPTARAIENGQLLTDAAVDKERTQGHFNRNTFDGVNSMSNYRSQKPNLGVQIPPPAPTYASEDEVDSRGLIILL